MERIIGRHDQRFDLLAGMLRLLDHRRHQFLIVGVQVGLLYPFRVAHRQHLGRHHHHAGRLRVGFGKGFFQHEEVIH